MLGHGLGNRAAKSWHGAVGFRVRFFHRPADDISSEPAGGQGNLATNTVAQDCVFLIFSIIFVIHVIFISICYTL